METIDLKDAVKRVVITNKSTGRVFKPGKKPSKGHDDLYDLAGELYDDGQCIASMDVETIALGADGTWYVIDECDHVAIIDETKYTVEIAPPGTS